MSGSLTIPNQIGAQPGPTLAAALLDQNWSAIATYVNAREMDFGTLASRPAPGTPGRWYYVTDYNVTTFDTGSTWVIVGFAASDLYGYLSGLNMSYVGLTGISVTPGVAVADDISLAMPTLTAFTGNTTGTFVVGTGNPKLDAGAVAASTWYHVYAIGGANHLFDLLFSTSASAPTMPSGFTSKRRIGSFLTDGSANIEPFLQRGDLFGWVTPSLGVDITNPGTAAVLFPLRVPLGVYVDVVVNVHLISTAASAIIGTLSAPDTADLAPSATASPLGMLGSGTAAAFNGFGQYTVPTDSLSQVRGRLSFSDANTRVLIATLGYYDRRGRDGA